MSFTANIVESPIQCVCCASNKLSILKLRKWNTICVGCCILLGIGGVGVSSFFLYKYLKLKKSLDDLETKVRELRLQLNLVEDNKNVDKINDGIDDLNESLVESSNSNESATNVKDDNQLESLSPSLTSLSAQPPRPVTPNGLVSHLSRKLDRKSLNLDVPSLNKNGLNGLNGLKSPIAILGRSSSFDSSESDSLNDYKTPSTSPTRSRSIDNLSNSKSNEDLLNKSPSYSDYLKNLDDNRSYELMLMQSLENKKLLCLNKQIKYEQDPDDFNSLIDYIKALQTLAECEPTGETKKVLQFKACDLAKKCLDLYPKSYLSHKWFAITTGRAVDFMGVNDKVKYGFEFKNHLDIAIQLNNSDYFLYYMRGRWAFKICNLNWAEKYGIRLVFGKMPNITLEDAMEDFLKVETLNKHKSRGNLLYLAKCLISKNEIEKAVEYLKIASELPIRTSEHELDNQEIISLLKKYSTDE